MSRRSVKAGLARKRMQAHERQQRWLAAIAELTSTALPLGAVEPADRVPGFVGEVMFARGASAPARTGEP